VATEFKLPELGENIEAGDLVRLMVAPGAEVSEGQPVMELETDKAVIEVPSSVTGVVKDVQVKEGDKIKVGQTVFTLDEGGNGAKRPAPKQSATSAPPQKTAAQSRESAPVAYDDEQDAKRLEMQTLRRDEGKTQQQAFPPDQPLPQTQPKPAVTPMNPPPPGASEFKLPELGENISEGDLVRLMISPGANVSEGQPVVELETDKAVVEVPSDVTGVVKEIQVKEGQKVKVGQVIFTLEGGAPAATPKAAKPQPVEHTDGTHEARLSFQAALKAEGKEEHEALPPDLPTQALPTFEMPEQLVKTAGPEHRAPIAAAPNVRRLARELGVDIYEVKGSGPGGRISQDDVKGHAKGMITAIPSLVASKPGGGVIAQPELPDFGKWGKVERVSMRGVRRKTAEHLSQAWNVIPHVTQHDKADITELEQLRAKFAQRAETAGGKMTATAIALKVCASALKLFHQFNASIDMAKEEVVYKQYINIGVAVDTDRGLLVPVIRDVDKKNIIEIAVELANISKKARDKKLAPEDMEGGTFTITNLGGLGGTAFTPIVNHPEVAILGMSRSRMEPVWMNGKFEPRLLMPLSLSYDHRLIDGADAVRFLRWIVEALEQPFLLSVQG
jgi:pyruvate dehydrogenase E2 component (dihydrolipoyllysine-residue acetyltransferase)